MRIRPYISNADFDEIKNWITDERTHALWCARRIGYPLEKENFERFLEEASVQYKETPFVATTDGGELVGFFCYSENPEIKEGMLKFVVTAPRYRNQGYGRQMIALAVKYGFETAKVDAVQLNVFLENTAARRCYLSVGFEERKTAEKAFAFQDETWGRCNMVIKRERWLSMKR